VAPTTALSVIQNLSTADKNLRNYRKFMHKKIQFCNGDTKRKIGEVTLCMGSPKYVKLCNSVPFWD
jgi:hypothetical protein